MHSSYGYRLPTLSPLVLALGIGVMASTKAEADPCEVTSWVAGTVDLCAGTLVYRDYVYDDYGAWRNTSAQSTGLYNFPAGDVRYPAGKQPNTADLVDLELRVEGGQLHVTAELNALYEPDSTVLALAIDTDDNPLTGGGQWPGLDISSTGWEVVHVFDAGDPDSNVITGSAPQPQGSRWRVQAVTAVRGGEVMNVAFRGPHEEAKWETDDGNNAQVGSWFEDRQALALATGDISQFGHSIEVADLLSGVTRRADPPGPGLHERVYTSAFTLPPGEGMSYSPVRGRGTGGAGALFAQAFHFFGKYQPYAVYVPDSPGPHGMQFFFHGSGAAHSSIVNQDGFQRDFGDSLNRVLVSPLGRGPDGYGSDISERDILDVWEDVLASYDIDEDRVFANGHSQGGYVAFRMTALHPDRFAGGISTNGFTGDILNPAPDPGQDVATAGAVGNMLDFAGNWRHLPQAMLYGNADAIVGVYTAEAMAEQMRRHPNLFMYWQHPTGDHFTLIQSDDFAKEAAFTANLVRVRNPARVVFRTAEILGNPELGIRHDRAYWVRDIRARFNVTRHEDAEDAYVDVDALTNGCSGTESVVATRYSNGTQPVPWVGEEQFLFGEIGVIQNNQVTLDVTNLLSMTLNTEDACLTRDPISYTVTTDGPVQIDFSDGRDSLVFYGAGTYSGVTASAPEPEPEWDERHDNKHDHKDHQNKP